MPSLRQDFCLALNARLPFSCCAPRVALQPQLLAALQKLRAEDRLRALEIEMGSVHVESGLTAEQWLKSRTQKYVFSGVVILFVLIAVLVGLSITRATHGSVDIEMGLHPRDTPNTAPINRGTTARFLQISDPFYVQECQPKDREYPFELTYKSERHGDEIDIRPSLPYAQILAKGGPVEGQLYYWTPFEAQQPELFVKVTNNTDETVLLSEGVCKVISSEIQKDQIIVFHEVPSNARHLLIENFGWGSVTNPVLRFRVEPLRTEEEEEEGETYVEAPEWYARTTNEIQLDSFDDEINVDLSAYLPSPKDDYSDWVTVVGNFAYGADASSLHTIMFYARVSLLRLHGKPKPPSWEYDLFLVAGKSNYEQSLDISQELKKGEADNFLIRIHSDKSAVFDTQFSFRTTSSKELAGSHIRLFLFEPRLPRSFACPTGRYYLDIPISKTLMKRMGPFVVALKYDPKDFRQLFVDVSDKYDLGLLSEDLVDRLDGLVLQAAREFLPAPKPAFLTYVDRKGSLIRASWESP